MPPAEPPLQILIAEDNPSDVKLLVRALRQAGFEFVHQVVSTEEDYLRCLRPDLDIILSDYAMPQFGGMRALELLRQQSLEIPFIIISGTIGEDQAVAAMKQGATDYLLKDRLARLGLAVTQAIAQGRMRRESRQAEDALRLFRNLVDQSEDTFEVIDPESGRFLDVNAKGPAEVGYTREQFLSLRVMDIDPTVDEEKWRAVVQQLRQSGASRSEALHRRADGSSFPVEILAKWVQLDREYIVAVIRNISDRKQAEAEQKQLEARFLRAQRMESIGTLASGVAHDLNNILAPIMMSVPVLRQNLTEEQREGIVATIEMSAARGAQIVKQVLTFGRGLEGVRVPLEISAIIKELLKIMRETFPKNLAIRSTNGGQVWPVLGDATQLHQVLLNLCVNARDAMPEGGEIQIGVRNMELDASYASMVPEAKPGSYVIVEVRDTGHGMPPEVQERIFDPFYTTKGVGHGSGLGLSTALGIVRSHGGFLQVQSQTGKGTTFQVYLPASADQDTAVSEVAETPVPRGRGELILVVDDEASVRNSVRLALETGGYTVLVATDGIDALGTFATRLDSVAMVITDLMMPSMDGLTLIRALRAMAPRVPIIASTGLGEKTQLAPLAALNVETVLHKPFGADTLLRIIHDMLRQQEGEFDI